MSKFRLSFQIHILQGAVEVFAGLNGLPHAIGKIEILQPLNIAGYGGREDGIKGHHQRHTDAGFLQLVRHADRRGGTERVADDNNRADLPRFTFRNSVADEGG